MSFVEQNFLESLVEQLSAPTSPAQTGMASYDFDLEDESILSTAAPSPNNAYSTTDFLSDSFTPSMPASPNALMVPSTSMFPGFLFDEADLTPASSVWGGEDDDDLDVATPCPMTALLEQPLMVSEDTAAYYQSQRLLDEQDQQQQSDSVFLFSSKLAPGSSAASLSKRGRKRKASRWLDEQAPAAPAPAPVAAAAPVIVAPPVYENVSVAFAGECTPSANYFISDDIDVESMSAGSQSQHASAPSRKRARAHHSGNDSELKRSIHNSLERKRRDELKDSFNDLRVVVPELVDQERAPKVVVLEKATDYIHELKNDEEIVNVLLTRARLDNAHLRHRLNQLRAATQIAV